MVKLITSTRQLSLRNIHGCEIPNIWVQVVRPKNLNSRDPAVLIVGSAIELENRTIPILQGETLHDECKQISQILVRYGINLITDACPGIPNLVEKAYIEEKSTGIALGISVLRTPDQIETSYAFSQDGFPSCSDVMLYCGSGFELLSIINTHCADLVLIIGGGLGSLMEGIIAVINDLPIICYTAVGGISTEIKPLFERYKSRYKNLKVKNCCGIPELDIILEEFSRKFRSKNNNSRLYNFFNHQDLLGENTISKIKINIDGELKFISYETGLSTMKINSPVLVIDDVQMLSDLNTGFALRSNLDRSARIYSFDNIIIEVPPGMADLICCPSIDTFILLNVLRKHKNVYSIRAMDVGTGTGIIGLWLAYTKSAAITFGIDTNFEATRCASLNATKMGLVDNFRIENGAYKDFIHEKDPFDLIVCTPPYVPTYGRIIATNNPFCGLDLALEVLLSIDQMLTQKGNCFITLSSVSWADINLKRLMDLLIKRKQAILLEEFEIPFKLIEVLLDMNWIKELVQSGGIIEKDDKASKYRFFHRLQIWRITKNN